MNTELRSNLKALLIGLGLAVVLVVVLDLIFGWLNKIEGSNSHFFPKSPNVDGLGWSVRNQGELRSTNNGYSIDHQEVFNEKTVFDVTYNYDPLYRRNVPNSPNTATEKFVLFFGGSQTFGEGLSDSETIPARVQSSLRDYRAYNYAYKGYGPHQMLKKLQTETLSNEVRETHGIAFYQYFGFHLQRVIGAMSYVSWAGGGAPYYKIGSNDRLEHRGSFATGRFLTTFTYWLLSRSAIAKYFRVDLPRQITQEHRYLLCGVLRESRRVFLEQYPGSQFVVIVSITNSQQDPIVQDCLEPQGIAFIDLRGLESGKTGLVFPHNGHFTPAATRLIADQLSPIFMQRDAW